MEFLAFWAVVFVFCGPVALIVAIAARRHARRLQTEVERLRSIVNSGRRTVSDAKPVSMPDALPEQASEPTIRPVPVDQSKPSPRPRPRPLQRKRREVDLESILGGQWLTWAGILALFFGTAFFLGVDLGASALSGLPQVLIGLAVAALFNTVGRYWSSRRERVLGLGLLGGGVALLYLAAYAAYGFHHLIPLWVAFPPMLGVAAIGAWLALDRNSVAIASLTLIGALLTPVVLSGGGDPTYALLPYLVAVNLGAVAVGFRRGWAGLPLGAFMATSVLILGWWDSHYRPEVRLVALLCVSALWLLYAIAPWLRRGPTPFWSAARAAVLAGNGLLYGVFCYHLLAPGWIHLRGLTLAVLALLYLASSRAFRAARGEDEASRLTHFTGVAIALVAIPVQLNAGWVTLSWTALACVLIYAGLREKDLSHRVSGLAVLAVTLLRSMLFDVPYTQKMASDYRPLWNGDFLAGLLVIAAIGWLLWIYRRHTDRLSATENRLRGALAVVAVGTLAWKLSLELVAWFTLREARLGTEQLVPGALTLTMFWAVYGLAALTAGVRIVHLPLRISGFLMLAASVTITTMMTVGMGTDLYSTYRPLLNLPFVQGCALTAALAFTFFELRRGRDALTPTEISLATPALVAAVLMFFLKISMEVLGYFHVPSPNSIYDATLRVRSLLTLSLVWALYSGAVIVAGFVARFRPVRILGMGLLGLTVLKVFLLDIQSLDRGYRIAAFVVLGILLLAVSLLYQRQKRTEEA
jgi:uncharacterized membrane protein